MIASLLLIAIGAADAVRIGRRRSLSLGLGLGVVVAVSLAAWLFGGVPLFAAVVVLAVSAVWVVSMSLESERPRIWPVALVGGAFAALAVAPITVAPHAVKEIAGFPLSWVLALLGVSLVMTQTANVIARTTLARVRPSGGDVVRPATHWRLRLGSRVVGRVERSEPEPPSELAQGAGTLRGGRLIGPIERLLIVALALAGAQGVIAALLAAKGIVRFPEISADRATGSKAEEFLIGSLTSWGLAALGAGWLWFVQRS